MKLSLSFFLAFLLLGITTPLYKAEAAGVSLGISPPLLEIQANPPTTVKAAITIQNSGSEPVNLKIIVKPFTASEKENGELRYLTEKDEFPGADREIFEKMEVLDGDESVEELSIGPEQERPLTLKITLPKNEPHSDYYFTLVFLVVPNAQENTNMTSATGGIGVNVLLSVGPRGKAKGYLTEFSTLPFIQHGPVPFTVKVKNTGKRLFTPTGEIYIKNMFGQTVGKVDLLPVHILGHTSRGIPDSLQNMEATISGQMSTTQYAKSDTPLAFWPETFLFGPYTATLTLGLSEDGPIYTKSVYFFAFPLEFMAGTIVVLCLGIIIGIRVRKRMQ